MIEKWKEYLRERSRKALAFDIRRIEDSFGVAERNGKLYLTQYDTAFAEVDDTATAYDIVALLDEARNAAVAFRKAAGEENTL